MRALIPVLAAMLLPYLADETPISVELSDGPLAAAIHADLSVRARESTFSGALVVAVDGRPVLEAGYGWADRSRRLPFTPSTVAQIGSLTKQFTAMAVIDLALEGKLAFDAPVKRYLPDAAEPGGVATIEQLLTHTSGLAEYCGPDFRALTRSELLGGCLARPLRFEPGTDRAYSNVGYSVLGALVEVVSGQTLDQYLQEALLTPNGLDSTAYFPADDEPLARGYLDGRDQGNIATRIEELDGDFWALKGNGGMQAPARDMYAWYEALAGRRALSDEHRRIALEPRVKAGRGNWEGFGWNIGRNEAGVIDRVSHAGSDGVFFSYFWWNPDVDRFFYLVGNNGEDSVIEAVRAVRRLMLEATPG